MSHQAVLEIVVSDLLCLAKAAEDVGAELVLDAKEYKTYSGHESCDHKITIPGNTKAFEIGILKVSADPETYSLRSDFYMEGYGLAAVVGYDACKLNQAYGIALFEKNLPFGYELSRQVMDDGEIVVEAIHA